MYQDIPSIEYYKEIERKLDRAGKKTSLTMQELQEQQQPEIDYTGQKTYTGYILTSHDSNALNTYTRELNRTRGIGARELLKDKRHQMYCIIAEQNRPVEQNRPAETQLSQAA